MDSEGDNVIFETIFKEQEQRILLRLQQVYHLPLERAEQECFRQLRTDAFGHEKLEKGSDKNTGIMYSLTFFPLP